MKYNVLLSIQGSQHYPQQEPQVIELVTQGTLEYVDGGWNICYEESELTGLAGVTTTFRIEPGKMTLLRTGKLRSQMEFQEGVSHTSLYEMEFGAMMITVCARQIEAQIDARGGTVDLLYSIAIENYEAGLVEYHLDITVKD